MVANQIVEHRAFALVEGVSGNRARRLVVLGPLLKPIVAGISDPDVAVGIRDKSEGGAEAELSFAGTFGAKLTKVFAGRAELLNSVSTFITDPDIAFAIDVERVRMLELAVAGAFGAELADEFPAVTEDGDAVVLPVSDPDVATGVNVDSFGRPSWPSPDP